MKVSLQEALTRVPGAKGEHFAVMFERGSVSVEVYAQRGTKVRHHMRRARSTSWRKARGPSCAAIEVTRSALETGLSSMALRVGNGLGYARSLGVKSRSDRTFFLTKDSGQQP